MSVSSADTNQFSVAPATLTIDGTATPSNQSTQAVTVTQNGNWNNAVTITVQLTTTQPIPALTFNVKKESPAGRTAPADDVSARVSRGIIPARLSSG